MSTTINALVDGNCLPVRLRLTAGQTHDLRAAPRLLEGLKCRHVVADRGYEAHNPLASQLLIHRSVNRRIYRQRNLVERFICKLKPFRRVAVCFDKLARNFLATFALASARLWTRTYEPTT